MRVKSEECVRREKEKTKLCVGGWLGDFSYHRSQNDLKEHFFGHNSECLVQIIESGTGVDD